MWNNPGYEEVWPQSLTWRWSKTGETHRVVAKKNAKLPWKKPSDVSIPQDVVNIQAGSSTLWRYAHWLKTKHPKKFTERTNKSPLIAEVNCYNII